MLSGAVDPAGLPGAVRVEPDEHRVARFDAQIGDEARAERDDGERR